jgi:hypothetical protein
MKILKAILIMLITATLTSFQPSDNTNGNSIKTEIKNFEKKVFSLSIDVEMDTNAIYTSVFVYTKSSKFKRNGGLSLKKDHSYLRHENDTILGRELVKENDGIIIKKSFIISKDESFENLKGHAFNGTLGQYIVGFDKNYLVIRSSQIINTTNSRNTGPSYFIEKYVYYKRKN